MADTIRKVVIPKENLPPVGSANNYLFRFRIISEDGNRFSSWSPIYTVAGQEYAAENGDGLLAKIGSSVVMATWMPIDGVSLYDIFVSLDEGDYLYTSTTSEHNYSFMTKLPNGDPATTVGVIIQVASQDRVVSNPLTIWASGTQTISAII